MVRVDLEKCSDQLEGLRPFRFDTGCFSPDPSKPCDEYNKAATKASSCLDGLKWNGALGKKKWTALLPSYLALYISISQKIEIELSKAEYDSLTISYMRKALYGILNLSISLVDIKLLERANTALNSGQLKAIVDYVANTDVSGFSETRAFSSEDKRGILLFVAIIAFEKNEPITSGIENKYWATARDLFFPQLQ